MRDGRQGHPFRDLGFSVNPYTLSSGGALQLVKVSTGELVIPPEHRWLTWMDDNQPTAETRHIVDRTEFVMVQLSTPIEFLLGDTIVNINRVAERIIHPLRDVVDKKAVGRWNGALVRAQEDERAHAAAEILAQLPADADPLIRSTVTGLRSRIVDVDRMVADLLAVRERLPAPMGMLLFDFRYMPDGRPVEWPANFKAEQLEVARRLGVPTLDFAPLIDELGIENALQPDFAHWQEGVHPVQARMIYDFAAAAVDRPLFADLPRPVPAYAGPEWDMAAQTDPVLAAIPERLRLGLRTVHEARLAELGVDASGLGAHYEALLARDAVFGKYEEAMTLLVLGWLPDFSTYAVMQAGLGQLAIALGMAGKRAVAYEIWPRRREATLAGIAWFEAQGWLQPGLVTVAEGFPDRAAVGDNSVAIGLELALGFDEDRAREIIDRLSSVDALLIQSRAFLRLRTTAEEQKALVAQLEESGLTAAGGVPSMGLAYFTGGR